MSAQTTDGLWQTKGACRGPQSTVFFPPSAFERKDEKEAREARAKAICATCTVREPCLDYAVRIREPHGIWGGLNEAERRPLLAEGDSPPPRRTRQVTGARSSRAASGSRGRANNR